MSQSSLVKELLTKSLARQTTFPVILSTLTKKGFESYHIDFLRAYLKIGRDSVFAEKARWRGVRKENIPGGSATDEQRSQMAFSAKTRRAAVLLPAACVGSAVTARWQGCSGLAALAAAKIPSRRTPSNFQADS